MRHQDLRVLLEDGRDHDHRDVVLDVVEGAEHAAAHVEVDLAGGEQLAVVDLRPARAGSSRPGRASRRSRRPPPDRSRHARPGPSSWCRRSPRPAPAPCQRASRGRSPNRPPARSEDTCSCAHSDPVSASARPHFSKIRTAGIGARPSRHGPPRVGIGGPVGSGKTALVDALRKRLRDRYEIAVITNDIYTGGCRVLDAQRRLAPERIVGVETGGCPHTAIREDASINLAAIEQMVESLPGAGPGVRRVGRRQSRRDFQPGAGRPHDLRDRRRRPATRSRARAAPASPARTCW